MTTVIERGLYVAVGAADLAAEKIREIPVIEKVRSKSILDQAREIEPKLREQADALQTRGQKVVKRTRTRTRRLRKRLGSVPTDARKQVGSLRTRAEQVLSRSNGTRARKTTAGSAKASS